jgi:hypothetical protein
MAVLHLSTAAVNAASNAVVDLVDGGAGAGTIKIYDGTLPTDANTAIGAQTLLATLTFSDPAFGNAAAGVATASTITGDTSADATGTAAWARIVDSTGATICDCDVSTAGATLNFDSVAFVTGGAINCTSFTYTQPDGS